MSIQLHHLRSLVARPRWQVLADLLTASDGKVERVEGTRTGFVESHSILGVRNAGGIYVYDERTRALFIAVINGRDADLSRAEIDVYVPEIVRMMNRHDSPRRRHRRNRRARRQQLEVQAIAERKVIPFPVAEPAAA